jgi:hypothetical protein
MKKLLLILIFTITSLFASATLFHGTTQTINVDSDPSGASVYVDGNLMGTTPVALNLKKNKYSTITIKKECYKPANIVLQKNFDSVAILDIFWDLSTTDFLTGAISEYTPNSYFVKLQKSSECKSEK